MTAKTIIHIIVPIKVRQQTCFICCHDQDMSAHGAVFYQNYRKQFLMAYALSVLKAALPKPEAHHSEITIAEIHLDQVTQWFDFQQSSEDLEQHIRAMWRYFIVPTLNTYPSKRVLTNLNFYEPNYSDLNSYDKCMTSGRS